MVTVLDDDAGQLILVGGIALAFVVIALALAFNGALFADSLADSTARADLDVSEQVDRQTARDVPRLLLYLNHRTPYADVGTLDEAVTANVSTYTRLSTETRLQSRPGVVNVTLVNRTYGTRVLQSTDGPFTEDGSVSGDPSWQPVDDRRAVGWAVLNLDAANVTDADGADRFTIELRDGVGNSATLYLSRNTTTGDDSRTVDVETVLSSGNGTAPTPCAPSQGRLLLDLRDGSSYGGGCTFNLTGPLEGPYEVRFTNGDAATGTYAFVTSGSPPNTLAAGSYACPVPKPCNAPVVWEATVVTSYETGTATTTNNRTVEVYS
ncbi:hypothetical protein [Salinigranum halophilum]|uniref:hypothetical protein n=1 Tax=Salinigranum halophilum TaxID=2565931 RepID=UPI0010A8DEFE|nr:hypothetical protein [Salinigranum halophilum]